MRRAPIALAILGCVLAACATPEVAKDHETKTYLPQEIEDALRSEDPGRRADAANQLETMAPERRLTVLVALVTDERASVRLMAVTLLGKHHADSPRAVEALTSVLSLDADIDVRSAAVAALAESRSPEALAALIRVLADDTSLVVKSEAAGWLDRRTGQSLGQGLVDRVDGAMEDADMAAMSYDSWFESCRDALSWDEQQGRFVEKDG